MQANNKFCLGPWKPALEMYAMLENVYGNEVLPHPVSLNNLKDSEMDMRPFIQGVSCNQRTLNAEKDAKFNELVVKDCRIPQILCRINCILPWR
jgi:hypothetical protein